MDIKDIKIGETYLLPVTVTSIEKCGWMEAATCNDYEYRLAPSEVKTLLQNGIKNTDPAPKYDPCRRFRKGDKVEYHPKDGRELFEAKRLLAQTLTVVTNEHEEFNRVTVEDQNGDTLSVPFYYFELVTPVEELEPYRVRHNEVHSAWSIYGPFGLSAVNYFYGGHYPYTKETAKAAAEAECARLNAEYRKEPQ